jgi:hypothetical protein
MKEMKRLSTWILASVVLTLAASPLLADGGSDKRTRVVKRAAAEAGAPRAERKATAAAYSAQVNIVTRVQGSNFFRTAIDITNNTTVDGVVALIQYCYSAGGAFQGCTPALEIGLLSLDNFHTDDMVDFLGAEGVIPPDARASSFGTMLVTFENLPSNFGWEGTVTARTYNAYQDNPALGTLAIAYPGSLFFESASGTLVGTIRDTTTAPTDAGALRTNLGVTNTDLEGVGNVDVEISFYDVTPGTATNGSRVGQILSMNDLQPGEVRQISNIFPVAQIPDNVLSCIAFVDVVNTPGIPTVEGYINILSAGTNDGAYFEMKCAAGCAGF